MAEVKHRVQPKNDNEEILERARDFWEKYNRPIIAVCAAIIIIGGGLLGYKYLIKAPKEQKANEAIWKAQDYFAKDSIQKALHGDGQYLGFEKIISEYGSTEAGNLARYYAGTLELKAGDNAKAINYLKDFSTDEKLVQARAYKLLGDAYANEGKNSDALNYYKKAAHEFTKDPSTSSEYLFFAAYFADRVMNDKKQAIDLFKELKKNYPNTRFGFDADKYLAQNGIYDVE